MTATRDRLVAAARELVIAGDGRLPTVGAVADRAGVSRLTVYHHFGSHAGLLQALGESTHSGAAPSSGEPVDRLRSAIEAACSRWAVQPALFRSLPGAAGSGGGTIAHELAGALIEADRLRPGCSLREAEDVIAIVTSFEAFGQLHHDGRRSAAAVADIMFRMASTILAS